MLQIKSNLIEAHIVKFFENKIRYLLLKRSEKEIYPNIWQMVSGKIRDNEKAYETVIREIGEETGLIVKKLYIVPKVNLFYDDSDNAVNFVPVFVALIENDKVTISSEHQEYRWVNNKEAKKMLAWPGQLESVDIIHDFFSKEMKNYNFIEIIL